MQFKDPPLFLSIILLTLALLTTLCTAILHIVFLTFPTNDYYLAGIILTSIEQLDKIKIMLILISLMLDLSKWRLFIIATQQKNITSPERFIQKKDQTYRVLVSLVVLIILSTLVFMILLLENGDDRLSPKFKSI